MTATYCVFTSYRGRDDDTVTLNDNTTWAALINTGWNQAVNTVFRIRMETEEQNNKLFQNNGTIEYRWNNSATWNQVTTSSSIVKAVASSQFADTAATTDVLTGYATNPFAGGEGTHDAVPTQLNISNQQVEHEYSLQIIGTDVVNADTIDFRPIGMTAETIYARVTVLEANSVTVNNATQGLTSDNIALVQNYVISINDSTQVLTSDNTDLVQNYVATVSDAAQVLTSDNINVTAYEPAAVLTTQDAGQILTSENVDLVQHHVLSTNDSTQILTSENVDLVQHHVLSTNDSAHLNSPDNVSLSLALDLVSNDASQLLTSENVDLTQNYLLAVNDSTQLLTSENVSVTYYPAGASLTVSNSTQIQTSENVVLTNINIVLVMFNTIHVLNSDTINLGGGGCTRQMMHYKRLRSKL